MCSPMQGQVSTKRRDAPSGPVRVQASVELQARGVIHPRAAEHQVRAGEVDGERLPALPTFPTLPTRGPAVRQAHRPPPEPLRHAALRSPCDALTRTRPVYDRGRSYPTLWPTR